MKTLSLKLLSIIAVVFYLFSCSKTLVFPDTESPALPQLENASAKLLWIGPEYKLAIHAELEDTEGITGVHIKNGEWKIDSALTVDNKTSYTIIDTFLVAKDVNKTKHLVEFTITNTKGGIIKGSVDVEDLSDKNQIPGYDPDLLPPEIEIIKPTVTQYLGSTGEPIDIDMEATIEDEAIASIEVRVWGESADGQPFMEEEIIEPDSDEEKISYQYAKTFTLPSEKAGRYQYIVRSVDESGNKKTVGGDISIGFPDRLYLSDAESEEEVIRQGYDHMGGSRGIGTLLSMEREGTNTFALNIYYPNKSADNIRFIAFLNNEKPFTGNNQSQVNYSLNGDNVSAMSASSPGDLTADLSAASFKLPVSASGYYRITVDLTQRTVRAVSYTPNINMNDAVKYPGWSDAKPWDYMAVTGTTVVGTADWTEKATSPKLVRDATNKYLFTGTFTTNGASSNMSLNAPVAVLGGDIWGKGWFRLVAARNNMIDDYGDLVTIVGPVGPSGGGANWGFSTSPAGTYKASYDLALQRFRLVRIEN